MFAVSVTTEKSNRAIEILVTSVDSNSLIFGKVLAGAISGLIQAGIILGSALISYRLCAMPGDTDWISVPDPGSGMGCFCDIRASGLSALCFSPRNDRALVSKTEDISKTSSGVMIIYMAAFFVAMYGLTTPDSMVVQATSFIPFTSSNSMLIRVAMGAVAPWEIVVSGVILGVSCLLMGMPCGKDFPFRYADVRQSHPPVHGD